MTANCCSRLFGWIYFPDNSNIFKRDSLSKWLPGNTSGGLKFLGKQLARRKTCRKVWVKVFNPLNCMAYFCFCLVVSNVFYMLCSTIFGMLFFRCFFSRGLKPPSSTKKLAFAGSIDTPILTHTHIRAVWSVSYFRFFQMGDVSFSRILLSFMPATSMTQGWLIISQTFPVVEWSLWSWKLGEGGFVVWRTAHSGLASDHSNKIQETKKNARLWMNQWLYESMVAVIKICENWTLDEVIVIVVIIHIYISFQWFSVPWRVLIPS